MSPCLLYDPQCPLCLRFKQAVERLTFDTDIGFRPITDESITIDYPFLIEEKYKDEVHLVVSVDPPVFLVGVEVIEFLAKHNPKVKKLAWLLETRVGEKASKLFYQSVNKVRQSLQNRCPKCKKERHCNKG